MKITISILVSLLLAFVTASTDANITAFTSRSGTSAPEAYDLDWYVTAADYAACLAGSGSCCYNPGILISSQNKWVITIEGSATGSSCVSSSLKITLTGGADADFVASSISLTAISNMSNAFITPTFTQMYYIDGSTNSVQFYKMRLPSTTTSYNAYSLNIITLPLASSAKIITVMLISFMAFFL